MPDQLALRGGTALENDNFTGVAKEVTVDVDAKTLRVHDGVQQGGFALMRANAVNGSVFSGDSGSGGVKGLVPAPVAGDGAAFKTLHADGTWKVPPSAAVQSVHGRTGTIVSQQGDYTASQITVTEVPLNYTASLQNVENHLDGIDTALSGKQNADATLTALAGLVTAADRVPYFTGSDVAAVSVLTAFARSMLAGADATSVRNILNAGDLRSTNNLSDVSSTTTSRTNIGAASQIDMTALQTTVAGKANTSHVHSAADITAGLLAHERGGLELDVSGFDGTVRITGGVTSVAGLVSQAEAEAGTSTVVREWTAERVAQTALVFGGSPGDILISFDEVAQPRHVLLNGATITGGATLYPKVATRYPWMVSGSNLILPDMRGRFIRAWSNGSANDPDRASRTARVGGGMGDLPGTYQSHMYQSHNHTVTEGYVTTPGNGFVISDGNYFPDTRVLTTSSSGGNETRPINIAVSMWMRVL